MAALTRGLMLIMRFLYSEFSNAALHNFDLVYGGDFFTAHYGFTSSCNEV